VPLAYGIFLSHNPTPDLAVVDLSSLALDKIQARSVYLKIGAMVSLVKLLEADQISPRLKEGVRLEAPEDWQRRGSVGGTLVVSDGRSPLTTLLLAMDARLSLEPDMETIFLGDLLPFRHDKLAGRLITQVIIPSNIAYVIQCDLDNESAHPSVCAAVARWPSGRTRIALGGYGTAPILAFDSPEDSGVSFAVEDAFSRVEDPPDSVESLQDAAVRLALAGLDSLKS
jgi:CO/xanthine dehydrogenase FAD-binding subunit